MKNTNTLLSIYNLKKYFPIAKESVFQKEQLYVRANEEITIDIQKGETFGLVGESGCGKSTLGRTILQLYPQTAGSTLYYGRTLEDFAPGYIAETLKNAPKLIANYKKMQEKAAAAAAEVEAAAERLAERVAQLTEGDPERAEKLNEQMRELEKKRTADQLGNECEAYEQRLRHIEQAEKDAGLPPADDQ